MLRSYHDSQLFGSSRGRSCHLRRRVRGKGDEGDASALSAGTVTGHAVPDS
jgi:hypothetical protein